MLLSLRSQFGLLLLVAALLTPCATTQVNAIWKDPSYQARPGRIMVIGLAKKPAEQETVRG